MSTQPFPSDLDPDRLKAYSLRLFGYMNGATISMMVCLGDRLGLYSALAGAGALSSRELARATGLDERWLREWLYSQGASGLLETRDGIDVRAFWQMPGSVRSTELIKDIEKHFAAPSGVTVVSSPGLETRLVGAVRAAPALHFYRVRGLNCAGDPGP